MTRVSVVILNYNGKDYLEQFLPSVIKFSQLAEIVVIDNASTDGSVDFLKRHHTDIRLIRLDTNLGYAGGYNEGLKSITSEYCILLNSDIEVTENWLIPILKTFESYISIYLD